MPLELFGRSKKCVHDDVHNNTFIPNNAPFHVNVPKNKTLLRTCNDEYLERRPEMPIPHANIRCSDRSIRHKAGRIKRQRRGLSVVSQTIRQSEAGKNL